MAGTPAEARGASPALKGGAFVNQIWSCQTTGEDQAFHSFDDIYRQPTGASPLAELVERLAAATPADTGSVELASYRGLEPPWNDWDHVAARGRHWVTRLARLVLEGET